MSKQRSQSLASLYTEQIDTLAEQPAFGGDTHLALAARMIMARHTRKLFAHLPGAIGGDDPHDIHQMRVSTRRLRACMEATAPAFRGEAVSRLRRRLRRLARVLGEVRDHDVLLMRLRADLERIGEMHGAYLNEQIARLEHERATAHAALIDELDRKRTGRLLEELIAFLTCPIEEVEASNDGLPLLVHHLAGSAIWRRYEAVRRFESAMPDASATQLHALRITCKNLRYTLELFEPALPDDAGKLIKQVTAMQEHLGTLHDIDVATSRFSSHPDNRSNGDVPGDADMHAYVAARDAERIELVSGVLPLWERINGDQFRRSLAKAIAAL